MSLRPVSPRSSMSQQKHDMAWPQAKGSPHCPWAQYPNGGLAYLFVSMLPVAFGSTHAISDKVVPCRTPSVTAHIITRDSEETSQPPFNGLFEQNHYCIRAVAERPCHSRRHAASPHTR